MNLPLKTLLLITDLGFLVYWAITGLKVLPPEWAYQDYTNPLLVSWNWSFFPLDLAASAFGLIGFALWKHRESLGRDLVLMSLALTSSSGLNAIAFWTLRGEFDPYWWGANAFLLLWPVPFLVKILRRS